MKNYITKSGWLKLSKELHQLLHHERQKVVESVSWAAKNGDRSENGDYLYGKRRLREIDQRIRFLTKRLESAEIVNTNRQKGIEQVFFGATVTIRRQNDQLQTVTIVGIDELNPQKGYISWISPLARTLLQSKVGNTRLLRHPRGEEIVEIITVTYGDIE